MISKQVNTVSLGDVTEIFTGFPFKSGQFNTDFKGVKLVRGKNVSKGFLRWGEDTRYWENVTSEYEKYLLNENDIVISMDGSLVGKNYSKIKNEELPLLLVQRVACLRAKTNIRQNFLYYLIDNENFINYVDSVKTGTSVPHISGKQIKDYKFVLPSLEVQDEIIKILEPIYKKIELNKKMIDNWLGIIQALYKNWFYDFEFPNKEGLPYKTCGGEFQTSENGPVPIGWKACNVFDVIEEVSIKNKENNDYPVLTVVKEGVFVASDEYFSKQVYSKDTKNYKVIKKHEVGFNPSRANIGSIAMLKEFESGLLSPIYKVFRTKNELLPFYFYNYMKQTDFIEWIKHYSSGTTRQNFDIKSFKHFKINVPPIEIQEEAYRIIEPIEKKVRENILQINTLEEIRKTILPKLLAGEINNLISV
ncbi:restriction endonuclease subunit S [Gottfriedia acidiceleris]|uniref:Restriction endonuclease subunit S n=1 Tax=Gottfriedia acidiceleris TaxID=371036 RepID=A0ABY4JL17_9BACI|nr:restriction endonuclease subunit S [Gottfriedia acidiceleris]UPM54524.1 restriction endonuclease subunit S [Gottfriedia acidiceleris]